MIRSLWSKRGAMVLLSESVNDPMPDKPEALNTLGFVYDDLSKDHWAGFNDPSDEPELLPIERTM
jgi:hypothetical protein